MAQHTITTGKKGFAAFLHLKGIQLVEVDAHSFTFASSQTRDELEMMYTNSEFARYNASFIQLSQMQRGELS